MSTTKRTTAARNAAFWKLKPASQRVLIAEDVLKQLTDKFYKANTGKYLIFKNVQGIKSNIPEKLDHLFRDLKAEGATCEVCAIGSIFTSLVNLGDNVACKDIQLHQVYNYMDLKSKVMREKMANVFPQDQRILIETAFEKTIGPAYSNESLRFVMVKEPEARAIRFGRKYKTDRGRLIGIMKNIIKNKGEFIP